MIGEVSQIQSFDDQLVVISWKSGRRNGGCGTRLCGSSSVGQTAIPLPFYRTLP